MALILSLLLWVVGLAFLSLHFLFGKVGLKMPFLEGGLRILGITYSFIHSAPAVPGEV